MLFLNPGILWALLALFIPVIIHLFNFQKTERVLFANTKLLSEVIQKTNKSRQVKNLFLLIVRLLALAFLILAFSQPFVDSGNGKSDGELSKVCVYIDNSSSMFIPDEGNRAFDKAIAKASGTPDQFRNKAWFQIISNDFLSKHLWTSGSGYKDQLTEIKNTSESRQLLSVVNRAGRQFDFQSGSGSKNLILLSDFQKSQVGDLSKLGLDSTLKIQLFPIEHLVKSNVWIDSVWLPKLISHDQNDNEIRISIKNEGKNPMKSIRLQLFANGNLLSGKLVPLNPGSTTISSLPIRIKPGENLNCTLSVDDSQTTFDNEFYFTLSAPKPIQIYLISDNATSYLNKVYSNRSLFNFTRSNFSNPDYRRIQDADLVIVEGAINPGDALKESLNQKMVDRGSVCLIPGPSIDWLKNFSGNSGVTILPVEGNTKSENWKIELPGKESSFFSEVFREASQNKVKPTSSPMIRLKDGNHLLKYESGDGFFVSKKAGNGKLYILSSPLSEKSGTFVSHPLMIPVFFRMAFLSSRSGTMNLYVKPNQTSIALSVDSIPGSNEAALEIIHGTKKLLANVKRAGKSYELELPEESLAPGFWEIKKSGLSLGFIAVNQKSEESGPEFYSSSELSNLFKDKPWITVQGISNSSSSEHLKNDKQDEMQLWKYCILLSILMFTAEIIFIRFTQSRIVSA